RLADRRIANALDFFSAARQRPARNRKSRAIEHCVHDVLAQAESCCRAAVSGEWNSEQLEYGNNHRLECSDAIDAFAQVECEIEISAAHALDPSPVGIHGDADVLMP